nr:MAG TPA: nucleoid-associated protein [Caudoviricetes sp.]
MTIKLADGRNELWQWDTGRKVVFDDETVKQAHFQKHSSGYGRTIDVDVEDGAAKIPDELLQAALPLTVYAYVGEELDGYTKIERAFTVKPRKRPAEYVFTPTEQLTLRQLEGIIGDLNSLTTTAKENLVAAINEAAKTGSGGSGSIDLRVADGYIQYSNDGGATWENLIAVADLKGDDGAPGTPGAPGKDGTNGQDGYSPSASVSETDTGATITITDKTGTTTAEVKNGKDGKDGAPGKDGTNGKDGSPGAKGDPGATPNLQIGTVETLPAGSDATASVSGTAENPLLDLGIPKGEAGGTDLSLGMTNAAVGQIAKITAVDADGKPTAWSPVDMPSGGGAYTILYDQMLDEAAAVSVQMTESAAKCNEYIAFLSVPKGDTAVSYTRFTTFAGAIDVVNNISVVSTSYGSIHNYSAKKIEGIGMIVEVYVANTTNTSPGFIDVPRTNWMKAVDKLISANESALYASVVELPTGSHILIAGR